MIECQNHPERPARTQVVGWLPLCDKCVEEINKLPRKAHFERVKAEWEKYTEGRKDAGN